MGLTRQDVEPLLETVSPWLSKPNIVGLHVGRKQVGGQQTEDWAIVVHVIEKKAADQLGTGDFPIPPSVELHLTRRNGGVDVVQVPTDVVESGRAEIQVLDQKARPCPGGFQIQGNGINGTGTLGVNIVWGGRYRLLTNNHVIADNGAAGSTVWQPVDDLGNSLTELTSYIPVTVYQDQNQNNPVFNTHDLAWCDIEPDAGAPNIYFLGVPTGVRAPRLGERVRMVGKQTGEMRHAHIQSLTFRVTLASFGGWVWYRNQIQLDATISQAGDSGAAYVGDDGMVVGLNVGSTALNSFGCPLIF